MRVWLSASVDERNTDGTNSEIVDFVSKLTYQLLENGDVLLHGTHSTIVPAIKDGFNQYMKAKGIYPGSVDHANLKQQILLTRVQYYTQSSQDVESMNDQIGFATVETVPLSTEISDQLAEMRRWFAERSDVIVAIGGKTNKEIKGVSEELDFAASKGRPCVVLDEFGGAAALWYQRNQSIAFRIDTDTSDTTDGQRPNSAAALERVSRSLESIRVRLADRPQSTIFRILSLDGGGIRGAFTAAVIASWEARYKQETGTDLKFAHQFNLIAGTSAGSILAAGLGIGMTGTQILDIFKKDGAAIFGANPAISSDTPGAWAETKHWFGSAWKNCYRWFFGTKHSNVGLKSILQSNFQGKSMDDSQVPLLITAVRLDSLKGDFFYTSHSPRRARSGRVSIENAVLASTAAPTYFPAFQWPDNQTNRPERKIYIDGGVVANHPGLAAVTQAIEGFNRSMHDIDLLSIGTLWSGYVDMSRLAGKSNVAHATKLVDLFMDSQSAHVDEMLRSMLAHRYLRINQQVGKLPDLDDVRNIQTLIQHGQTIGIQTFPLVFGRFLRGQTAQPWKRYPE
jgi:patatin-like phospholipase/acyl hydrolase